MGNQYDDALAAYNALQGWGDNGDWASYDSQNGWRPSSGNLSRISGDQSLAKPYGNGYSVFDVLSPDGSIKKQVEAVSNSNTFMDRLGPGIVALPFLAGTALGATGIGSSATDTGAGAGGFSIPTADELSAAGFGDGAGVGMTGAGGIGSVSSVAGALGPAAYTDLGYAGVDGLSSLLNGLSSAAKSALTPSNIAKVAAALKGAGGGSSTGGAGMNFGGGMSGVFNQVANETPGMIATQAQAPQQQQLAQALLLGDSGQQKFSPLQFNPVQLAQALQDN